MISVYNGIRYIRESLESALNQRKSEVIVVDDGSTDGTTEFLKELRQDKKFKVIFKENGGPASALNAGIRVAKGDWIKWLSADDILDANCVERLLEYAKDKKTIYYTHYVIIDKDGKFIKLFTEPERVESDLWKLFYGNGSSSIIHKDVFKLCGLFDENLRHSEDYEFWLRATQLYGVHLTLIPEYTLKYRRHPDQLTNKVGGTLDQTIKDSISSRLATLKH